MNDNDRVICSHAPVHVLHPGYPYDNVGNELVDAPEASLRHSESWHDII